MFARLWSLRDERPTLVAVTLLAVALLAVNPLLDWWLRATTEFAMPYRYFDFGAFRTALDRWNAGEALYLQDENGSFHGTYLYPPAVLGVFMPFDGMEHSRAAATWGLVTLGLLWVGLQLVVRSLGYRLRVWERLGLGWLVVGFQPVVMTLKLGQMALFQAALLSFALVALVYGEDGPDWARYLSGALTALVGVAKLSYAPIGAHLLQHRDRFLGALGAGVAFLVVSVAWFGWGPNRAYVDVLVWGVEHGGGSRPPTLWLPPYYRPLHWLPAPQLLRLGACLAIVVVSVLAARGADRTTFALGVAAFPLLSPLPYAYYFVALLPVTLVLIAGELERPGGYPSVPIVALLLVHFHVYGLKFAVSYLPEMFPPVQVLSPYWVLQPGLWGNLLLAGLAFVRVAQRVEVPEAVAAEVPRLSRGTE